MSDMPSFFTYLLRFGDCLCGDSVKYFILNSYSLHVTVYC